MRSIRMFAGAALVTLCGCFFSASVLAQDIFPSKPIRLVPAFAGVIDALSRGLAEDMQKTLGQGVIVDTKVGASGMIAAESVASAKADGYTILLGTNTTHAANQSLFKKLPYDFVKDFVPIGGIAQGVVMLVANPRVPVKNLKDLTELAKAKPGALKYGWGSSSGRVAAELYKQMANVDLLSVPYKSPPQALLEVISGEIDVMWAETASAESMVKDGKLKALAVTGKARLMTSPEIPTMAEAGLSGYELTWWVGAWAPAKTPPQVIEKLSAAFRHAAETQSVKRLFQTNGLEPFPISSDELMKFQVIEERRWRKVITTAGIEPQ